jgi:hypothetical protein
MALVLGEIEERKLHRDDSHASMWGLLRAELAWSDRDCQELMRVARLVREHPDAGESLVDHRASVANIAEIARAHARLPEEIEPKVGTFLWCADRSEHDQLRLRVRSWEQRADAKAAHESAQSAHERRSGQWTANEAGGAIAAEFGPVDALANREILDRYLEAEWLADWEATVERFGDDAAPHLMPRAPSQRRADALTRALHDAAAREPGARAPEPVVNVHVDHDTFQDILVEAGLLPERNVDPFEEPEPHETERMCHTEHGDPIDPWTVFQLMMRGHIRYVIRNERGIPIKWGRRRRLFSGPARDAVRALSTRCIHPGCRVPTKRTQTDHLVEWRRNGRTQPDNGGPGCRRHNLAKEHRGYTVYRDPLGEWHTYRPDGTEIA